MADFRPLNCHETRALASSFYGEQQVVGPQLCCLTLSPWPCCCCCPHCPRTGSRPGEPGLEPVSPELDPDHSIGPTRMANSPSKASSRPPRRRRRRRCRLLSQLVTSNWTPLGSMELETHLNIGAQKAASQLRDRWLTIDLELFTAASASAFVGPLPLNHSPSTGHFHSHLAGFIA